MTVRAPAAIVMVPLAPTLTVGDTGTLYSICGAEFGDDALLEIPSSDTTMGLPVLFVQVMAVSLSVTLPSPDPVEAVPHPAVESIATAPRSVL